MAELAFSMMMKRKGCYHACRESESKGLYPIVILALSTGMRRGEIMNLKWSDIDLARGSILLQTTKNGERRFIPLVGMALDLLRSKYANQAVDSLVFPAPHAPCKPIDIRSAWETALSKANIFNFRFHDLRHTAASYLAMNQASLLEIGTLLGPQNRPNDQAIRPSLQCTYLFSSCGPK